MIKIISFETSMLRNKKAFENRHTSSKGNSTIKRPCFHLCRSVFLVSLKQKQPPQLQGSEAI